MKTKLTVPLWSLTGLFMAVGLYVLLHGGWPRVRPITLVKTVWQTNTIIDHLINQVELNKRDSMDPWQKYEGLTNSVYVTNLYFSYPILTNALVYTNVIWFNNSYVTNHW